MKAAILTIGDELLIGQVINTNAAWLGEQLDLAGVDVVHMVTLGDDEAVIQQELESAYTLVDAILITGGLGPTHDDVTREAVARFFGVDLVVHEDIIAQIERRFAARGLVMPASNRTQAMVPEGFEVLPNPVGTAPGLWFEEADGERERILAVLPGVPYEMKRLMQDDVLPRLLAHKGLAVIRHRTLLTTGIGESNLQDEIGDLSTILTPSLRLAYLPGTSGVRLRLSARGTTEEEVTARLDGLEAYLRSRIARYIYGTGDEPLEAAVGRLLAERGLTVATAESCTGGHVVNRLTNISGSSAYVMGGVVAYSNAAKVDLLGVDPELLEEEGAVSKRCAVQLARGARARFGADIGISTTGVAGPTGGTADKPVGLVWVGYADAEGECAVRLHFGQDRLINKERFVTAALNIIRRQVLRRDRASHDREPA